MFILGVSISPRLSIEACLSAVVSLFSVSASCLCLLLSSSAFGFGFVFLLLFLALF